MGTVTPADPTDARFAAVLSTAAELTIAVLTFRRPDDLREVLPSLVEQAQSVESRIAPRILVVDNDPEASARELVESTARTASIPIDYVSEMEKGIAAARNRALTESVRQRILVFLDDDERPSVTWLADLLALHDETGAQAVVGPVVSAFAREPDPWITAGEFFVRRRLATGTAVEVAATNNLLLDLDFVRHHGLSFDRALGVYGGEDTLFTRQIVARGGSILWCAEAEVTDVVPQSRLTRRWVIQRAFSSGNGWSLTSLLLTRGLGSRLRLRLALSGSGVVRVAGGVARLGIGVVTRSMRSRARGVRTMARGAGMVSGAWGYAYQEYRRA